MTTLNIHAQESKSRFSCLSASDPENIPDVRKEKIKISVHYESTEVKQTAAARPKSLLNILLNIIQHQASLYI